MRRNKIQTILAGIIIGLAIGLCLYTFVYAKGGSYLTNNPGACANCHIMQEQYDGWLKSSHHSVAVCNDCHTPPGFIAKYMTKASNGFWHSFAFTTGRFHEPIQVHARNQAVVEQACRKCHQEIVTGIEGVHADTPDEQLSCVRCHRDVGHKH
jgi:cytochrome c nitrite reductase small subunit